MRAQALEEQRHSLNRFPTVDDRRAQPRPARDVNGGLRAITGHAHRDGLTQRRARCCIELSRQGVIFYELHARESQQRPTRRFIDGLEVAIYFLRAVLRRGEVAGVDAPRLEPARRSFLYRSEAS